MTGLLVIFSKEINLSSEHRLLSNTYIIVFNWVLTKTSQKHPKSVETSRNHPKTLTIFKKSAETRQNNISKCAIFSVLPIRPDLVKFQKKFALLKVK